MAQLKDMVAVQGGFKPSVELPDDFYNEETNRHFVQNYLPTPDTIDIFLSVLSSLQPGAKDRARLIYRYLWHG